MPVPSGVPGAATVTAVISRRASLVRSSFLAVAALGLLAGCWTSSDDTTSAQSSPTAVAPSAEATADASPTAGPTSACPAGSASQDSYECVGVTVTGAKDEEPTIALAKDFAPVEQLVVADVYEGTGTAVQPGDTLTVNYVGMGEQSRDVFDSSWTNGSPATFPLDNVIEGWRQGMLGMKEGGRRILVIPGSLAYGDTGNGGAIAPNETLVFVVDLVAVNPA